MDTPSPAELIRSPTDAWGAALEHLGGEILRYRTLYNIFASSPDALLVTDESHILAINRRASLFTGYHDSELLNHPLTMLIPDSERPVFDEAWARMLVAPCYDRMAGGQVMHWQKKTGVLLPVMVTVDPQMEIEGLRVTVRGRHVPD